MKKQVPVDEIEKVVREEWDTWLKPRRAALAERFPSDKWLAEPTNLFGIALSGGGIRSATVSLGFLNTLKQLGVLQKADYLSTVSGGGYLGGYLHAKLSHQREDGDPFADAFQGNDFDHLQKYRKYLTPGGSWKRLFMDLQLVTAFIVSTVMNAIWLFSLGAMLWFAALLLRDLIPQQYALTIATPAVISIALLLMWHYFGHPFRHRRLWSSDVLYSLEAFAFAVFLLAMLLGVWRRAETIADPGAQLTGLAIATVVLLITGFFANPNVLTMHRYYRDRIASAFLRAAGREGPRLCLHQLADRSNCHAPYPLINTCLNLRIEDDPAIKGALSSDYFLLSPLRCGSNLTGWASTNKPPYDTLRLVTAIAASGAALSPAMGTRTNRFTAFLMTVLNLRLGHWMPNPKRLGGRLARLQWWPWYHFQEMLARAGLGSRRVIISDGGHIENLGVFELLRRRCRLIIALDAGADPEFRFGDLENLIRRAREQLGIEIDFGRLDPVDIIRPSPSKAYSDSHFAVARIRAIDESPLKDYEGLLVYVKPSLRPRKKWGGVPSSSHDYKRHHPAFPHESTANQFFDTPQWMAYYRLGRFLAGDVLGFDVRDETVTKHLSVLALFERWGALDKDTLLAELQAI